ncbi:MAG TPA: TonB family protein [Sphingomonadaceae bacterium]|jgi:protein TonB|nr:TonB family protein [Sphingomonadaceae bacterium]
MKTLVQLDGRNRDRIKAGVSVAAIHVLLGYALLMGLGYRGIAEAVEAVQVFDVLPEKPPPPEVEPAKPKARQEEAREKNPEGAASPKNLKDTPTPMVLPPPPIPMPVVNEVLVAPVAAEGNRASAGASDVRGPGTGSGGQGTGLGSGDSGNGTGGGGGGGTYARGARWISGEIYDQDRPRAAYDAGFGGTVHLRFVVAPTGRVSRCDVTRTSGRADVDKVTCRMILKRFRYRPARDDQGEPVPFVITGTHEWMPPAEGPTIDIEPTIEDD